MRFGFHTVWFFTLIALIFFTPVYFGSIMLLNELIFIVATILSVAVIAIYKKHLNLLIVMLFIKGLFFSAMFLGILILRPSYEFNLKDFIECFKPIVYALILISGYLLSKKFTENQTIRFIIVVGILSILFSCLVYFPFFHSFIDLFKGRPSTELYNFHFFRFSGTFGYPGAFGYWLTLVLSMVLLQKYRNRISLFQFFLLFGFIFLGLILTGSRGALAVFAIVMITTFMVIPFNKNSIIGIFLVGLGLVGIFIVISSFQTDNSSISHFQSVLENPFGGTFEHRANELVRLYESLLNGELIGHGPNNFHHQKLFGPIESAYYYYGYKFGLIGLLYYFLIIAIVFIILFRFLFVGAKINFCFFFCIWALVNLVIASISNSITEEYKSFYIFFLLVGFVIGFSEKYSSKRLIKLSNCLDTSSPSNPTAIPL